MITFHDKPFYIEPSNQRAIGLAAWGAKTSLFIVQRLKTLTQVLLPSFNCGGDMEE